MKKVNNHPIVIVKMQGGLGNQLFQYMAGLHFSNIKNGELLLDGVFFLNPPSKATPREFKLKVFPGIEKDISTTSFFLRTKIFKILRPFFNFFGIIIVTEDNWEEALSTNNKTYILDGYWQDLCYLPDLLKTNNNFLNSTNFEIFNCAKYLDIIKNKVVTSIHFRRGDYVTSAEMHGVCDLSYYQVAIEEIKKHNTDYLLIFTDDKQWVKDNFYSELPFSIVDLSCENSDIAELLLMASCHHHIIANSTFSWWGAFLNYSSNKKVIYPKSWFVDSTKSKNRINGLMPQEWIGI